MIPNDFDQNDDIQIIDGNFALSSGSNDPSAFFNMNLPNMQYQNNQPNFGAPSSNINLTGGIGFNNTFGMPTRNDDIIVPNTTPQGQSMNQGPQCSGNCGACVWSFLCRKATANLTSIGGGVPKLC